MASVVETQRLISVSLGKIARSRQQRGGINLHKNLLVASVLNKARTAFMMENYSHQQQPHHKQQQVILTQPQQQPSTPASPAYELRDGNSLTSHVDRTCQATPDVESRSTPIDTQATPEPVCAAYDSTPCANTTSSVVADKENVSPSSQEILIPSQTDSRVVDECKQESVSGEQHIEAANQLSLDAQSALGTHSQSSNNTPLNSSCKQSSATPTCNGVLKRRRDNLEASVTCESDYPASKKARVASDSSPYSQVCSDVRNECELDNESSGEVSMQCSDSPQISNLVSIFNSGFSGLCVSPSSSLDYESSDYPSNSSSVSHQWSSDSQSLHCSYQVERIESLSSAIVLSA